MQEIKNEEWLPVYQKEDVFPSHLNKTFGELHTMYIDDINSWLEENKEVVRKHSLVKIPKGKMLKIEHLLKNPYKYLDKETVRDLFTYKGKLREYSDKLSDHFVELHDKKRHSLFGPNLSVQAITRELIRFNNEKDVNGVVIKHHDYPDDIFLSSTNRISSTINQWFPEIYECAINTPPLIDQVRNKDTFYARVHRIAGLDKFGIEKNNGWEKTISSWLPTYMKVTNGNQIAYNFPLPLAKWLYTTVLSQDKFENDDTLYVADMSMGWGGRLAGLMSALEPTGKILFKDNKPTNKNVVLMGTDVNKNIEDHYRRLYNFWKKKVNTQLPLEFYNSTIGAENILEDENFKKNIGKFHYMFTSPPYFNKEKYSEDENQSYLKYPKYNGWVEGFLEPMLKNVYELLRPGGECWINIADVKKGTIRKIYNKETGEEYTGKLTKEMKDKYDIITEKEYYPIQEDTIKAAEKAGFKFRTIYKMIFGIVVGTRKKGKTAITQNVFKIGNRKLTSASSDDIYTEEKLYKWEPIFIFDKI